MVGSCTRESPQLLLGQLSNTQLKFQVVSSKYPDFNNLTFMSLEFIIILHYLQIIIILRKGTLQGK